MANLFWKRPNKEMLNLVSVPFTSEDEFERTVFNAKGLLEDVFLIKRQVRGGRKAGIPDIVGIDSEGAVCIVEMKNESVDVSILPRVLQYAFWAETNPDSIKTLWLESPVQPDEIEFSSEHYEVRIIIIAPAIDRSTLGLAAKINYEIDLIEVKCWKEAGDEFLLVNKLEPDITTKVRPVRGMGIYDRNFYEEHYNSESVGHFHHYVEEIVALVRKHGWAVEPKFNKYYCGFKYGFFNAFGIKWIGTKSFAFFFKLPEAQVKRLAPKAVSMTKYEHQWKEALFKIDPGQTTVDSLAPLFVAAWEGLTGKK